MKSLRKLFLNITLRAAVGTGALWLAMKQAGIEPFFAFKDASVSVFSITLFSLVINIILRHYRPSNGKEWNLGAWILVLAFIWFAISESIVLALANNNEHLEDLVISTSWLRILLGILVLTCVSVITWIRYQLQSDARGKERLNEMEKLAKDAELHSLRQQLQPHFLFNSLNSIYALIGSNPADAKKMVQQLADFLRGTLRKDQTQLISISEEINQVKLYLEIEKIRFNNRLEIIYQIDADSSELKIPVLLLQPALENAIKFGLYETTENVKIYISASKSENFLIVQVANPFQADSTNIARGTGFGLDSIRSRLRLIYGRNDLLDLNQDNQIFTLTIKIPQLK